MPSRQASTKISSSVRPAWTVSWRHSGRRRCNANGPVQCGCGRAPRVTVAMHGGNKCNLFESSHDYRVSYCTRDALPLFFAWFRTVSHGWYLRADRDFPASVGASPVSATLFVWSWRFRALQLASARAIARVEPWGELRQRPAGGSITSITPVESTKRWLVKRLLLDPGDVCRDYRCAGALSAPWSRRAPTTTLSPASSTRGREHGGARLFALCAAVDGEIVPARTTRAARSSVPPLARPAAGADRPRGWRRGARRALPPRHLAPTAGALHRAAVAAPRSRHAARSRARSRAPLARVRVDSAQCSGSMPSCSGSSRA